MAFAASYTLGDTSPAVWTDLPNVNREPGSPKFGSAFNIEERNITHTTNMGVRHVYRQFTRNVWQLTFRITHTQMITEWLTMHETVDGEVTPFYFRIGDNILYCRKEAGFAPRMLEEPTADQPVYDYTITLTEEFNAADF